ncbi:hypothetical protein PR202_ga12325 [Eleusine coracana subsp. coracana]|uniref:Fungal lipase-type domain-containing protein n=1 Tax=Eleusine coracana subsp. coracana TaxID=191504 RepID=A0AAV5CBD3_ELECO|nr:hypothetical protein PR202_ga12325 [Eleusine coracana subsp. coracana]
MAEKQLNGGQNMGPEMLIIRPEKVRLIDLLSLLLLRRPITSYRFVEVSDKTSCKLGSTPGDWVVALTVAIQKVLAAIYWPARWLGFTIEFLLNFLALNSGILGIIWNIFRCKLVIPFREAANFRSIIGMIDGRTELKPVPASIYSCDEQQLHFVDNWWKAKEECIDVESGECYSDNVPLIKEQYYVDEVTVMAAKLAYENEAYIKNVVNNIWKFNFVGFYSCWNKFMGKDGAYTTQAFVMTDRPSDAGTVLVAFRGTEPFNMQDWSTDVNLSWMRLGAMGNLHVGFLKALGLQEEDPKDPARAFPRDAPKSSKPVAYYALRDVLRVQLKNHPNAKIIVTGHSLGGALAAVFPALLAFHGESDVLGRLLAVHTYGQPRVGDEDFATFCTKKVQVNDPVRAVYRYDIVPRVPFDVPPVARFTHGGECVYYDGWYAARVLPAGADVPDKNYFDPRYLVSKYGNALGDLVKGAFLWVKEGRDYREGAVSLLYRASGLIIPGLASHSPRDYVNAVRLGRVVATKMKTGN